MNIIFSNFSGSQVTATIEDGDNNTIGDFIIPEGESTLRPYHPSIAEPGFVTLRAGELMHGGMFQLSDYPNAQLLSITLWRDPNGRIKVSGRETY